MRNPLATVCACAAIVLTLWIIDASNAPRFALVSYYAEGAALESEVLDSGLSVTDCAFALEQAGAVAARAELLITCEREQ